MYMCECVCVCMYVHVCMCVCMYVCMYICYFFTLCISSAKFLGVFYDPRSGRLRPTVRSSTTHGRVVDNGMCVFFDCPKLRNTRARRR